MKRTIILITAFTMAAASCTQGPSAPQYPVTAQVEHIDTYFGTNVADPYRWLENDRSDSTAAWVKAENEVTFGYLAQIPFRENIRAELTKMWNYPRNGVPVRYGDKYFVWRNDGLQNQSVLYLMDSLSAEARVFIDPNALSADGTTSVGNISVSHDNRYVAYTQSSGGSDWKEIRVKTMDGKDLTDVIRWVKFSGIAWHGDGFYYCGYDEPKGSALSEQNQFNKIFYHKLGAAQRDDKLIYEDLKNPLRYNRVDITDDERLLVLSISAGTDGNTLALKKAGEEGAPFVPITPNNFNSEWIPIDNFGDELYVLTNHDAPRYKLMKVSLNGRQPKWDVVIPEDDDVITSVNAVGEKLVVQYLHNAYSQVFLFNKDGNAKQALALPGIGTLSGLSGNRKSNEMFYSFTSFATPPTIFRIADVRNPAPALYSETKLSFVPSKFVVEQVWFASKDSTCVPMFLVHKEGVERNGANPTLLYGYGGFNNSVKPSFSIANMLFLEYGGIYAVANIRGGGEFGSAWHKAGTRLQKQNVFDDFIAAAEFLIREKYTSSAKLAIRGGSNGGLLVGACITQRPELFRVALPAVGVMDMLRFHKFTVGWGWVDDYGSSDNEAEFRYIYRYSPLHNIKAGTCYPATLITTADHDDRVVPAHSFKFAATMQAAQSCANPVLIRVDVMSGHGASSTAKAIEQYTDMWAFTFYNLGMKF